MAADPRVAAQWNNRSMSTPPKRTGPNLSGVTMGVPGSGVPDSSFKDVQPAMPTGDTNPTMRKRRNIWTMAILAAALVFLLHLARG